MSPSSTTDQYGRRPPPLPRPAAADGPRAGGVTPLGHDRLMTASSYQHRCDDRPARMFVAGYLVVSEWYCPVCDAPAHRTHQAGRPRVYCTNACRQRAYRWRRDNHARLAATRDQPAERAHVGIRSHALRSSRDFVSKHSDQHRREVTVCGAFGRPARHGRFAHTNFTADNSGFGCRSCIRLIAIPNETIDSGWPPPPPTWEQTLRRMA